MYKLVTAFMLSKTNPKGLVELNVSDLTLTKLIKENSFGYLVLSNNHLPGEHYFTLDDLVTKPIHVNTFDVPVSIWLDMVKDKVLHTRDEKPYFSSGKLNYMDGYQTGLQCRSVHRYSTIPNYDSSARDDLIVTKETLDNNSLAKNGLFVINGCLHSHSLYRDTVKVSDGAKSMMNSGYNQIGLISFEEVGGVEIKNITTDMVNKTHENISLYQEMIIDTGMDLTGKSVMMSIAGKLIHLPTMIKKVDDKYIHLMISEMDLITHIFNTIDILDYSIITHYHRNEMNRFNPWFAKQSILSDPFILEIMRMSQTFIIVVDKPMFYTVDRNVHNTGIYGRYKTANFDNNLCFDRYGKIVNYFNDGEEMTLGLGDTPRTSLHIPYELSESKFNLNKRKEESNVSLYETLTHHATAMPIYFRDFYFVDH